jgi:hypothetical protein
MDCRENGVGEYSLSGVWVTRTIARFRKSHRKMSVAPKESADVNRNPSILGGAELMSL